MECIIISLIPWEKTELITRLLLLRLTWPVESILCVHTITSDKSDTGINAAIRTSLSAERTVSTAEVHSSLTPLSDQFYTNAIMSEGSSHDYNMEEGSGPDKQSYVAQHKKRETGGLMQTSISPNKNHVTAISVNSPQDVLRSFRRELVSLDTTKQTVEEEHRNTHNSSARLDNSSLRENHYPVPNRGLGHFETAAPYLNVASDSEVTLQYHNLYNDEYHNSSHVYSKDGRIFKKKGENRSVKVQESAEKGKYLVPRHHSMDSSKQFYFIDKKKHPKVIPKADYFYGHASDYNKVHRSQDDGMYARKSHPVTTRRVVYPASGHYSDTETMNHHDFSSFEVISLASSSDTDVFVTADISDDNHKKRRSHDKLTRKYTILSGRDYTEEVVPIYARKPRRRSLSPVGRRYSTSRRERARSHSRHRRRRRSSRDSEGSVEYDDDEYSGDTSSHRGRSTHRLKQKKRDKFSLNRNDESSTKVTSFGDFSSLSYPMNTIPQGALNTNFALYPFTGLSPTFQNAYAGFPFPAAPAYTNHLYRNSALDFATVRNYLGAMSASLASIPTPAIGTTPYISQQILQSNIPDRLEGAVTQDLFNNTNHNNMHANEHVFSNSIDTKSQDKETKFLEDKVIPASSIPPVADVPSAPIGHIHTRLTEDSRNITQGLSKQVFELNPVQSLAIINTHSLKTRPQSNVSTDLFVGKGGNTDKNASKATTNEGNDHKFRLIHSQLSKELSARFLSNVNSTGKRIDPSPVQPDVDQHKSSTSMNSASKSTPSESGAASADTNGGRWPLKRSVSTDSQTPKSPPPATFPKPKCAGERVKSPVSPLPSQPPVVPDSSKQSVRKSSTAYNEYPVSTDDFLRSLGSNFFEISELKVIDTLESVSQDFHRITKTEKQTKHSKESSPVVERAGEKYSITQICCPQMSTSENLVHPEADYDIYPRRLKADTVSGLIDKPAVVHGNTEPLPSPTKVRFESPEPPQQTGQISVKKIVNDYTRNILGSLTQHSTPSTPGSSQPELHDSYQKSFNNRSNPRKYPADKPTAAPFTSQRGGKLMKSYPSTSASPEGVNDASLALSAAKSSQDRFKRSPHSVKLNDTDTDFKDTSYHFYTGPLSSQSKSYNGDNCPPDITEPNSLDNEERNIFDESFYNNMQRLRADSVKEKYIFYKGNNVKTSIAEEPAVQLFTKVHATNHGSQEDPKLTNYEPTRQISFSSKTEPYPEPDKQPEDGVLNQKYFKTEVPIPPRDFDSDADSSEYLYTSQGWTHLPGKLIPANVMYCTHVEDNSAEIVHQIYKKALQNEYPNESILDKFFRDCLPTNELNLQYTNVRKSVNIFDRPFSDELSKSTVSLKWTSEMNLPLKDPIFEVIPQRRAVTPETSDLDSGVSLASQMSIPSLNVCSNYNRDSITIPGEDHSGTETISSRSSIQLGWDYLSWNDSLQQKNRGQKLK